LNTERAQLEKSLSELRHKLRVKDQVGAVIEGKHSKLAEVYRALEAECKAELDACRGVTASGTTSSVTDSVTALRRGGAARGGEGGPEGGILGGGWGVCLLLLLGAVGGYLSTAVLPPPVLLARRVHRRVTGRGRRTVDVDGWALPSTHVDSMKLS
jgi:hypothetical protein